MKQKGALTIEATLLMIIILSIVSALITVGVTFQKNMQLYAEVDQSAQKVALFYYASQRVGNGISNNGDVFKSSDISSLGSLLLGYGKEVATTASTYAYAGMLKYNLVQKYGGDDAFNQKFWLERVPKITATMAQNCIVVDVKKTFSVKGIIPIAPNLSFEDRHIIPIKSSVSLIAGYGNPRVTKIYVTEHGKTKTHVYHVYKDCFAGRAAKGFEEHQITQAEIGGNISVGDTGFHICSFCKKKLESGD